MNRSQNDCAVAERLLNATTKVRRYNASGAIQNNGTGAISVEKYVVTASIRLDGTNASAVHAARCSHLRWQSLGGCSTSAAPAAATPLVSSGCRRQAASSERHAAATKTPYASAQDTFCVRSRSAGSIRAGYAMSASRLPTLLAA